MAKKISVFISGLFIMAIGVALSVKADLGVSPISCTPYVFSMKLPLTLGEVTIIFNALLIILQIAVLRRKYPLIQLIQLPAVVIFGYCIDFVLYVLSGLAPASYAYQVLWCAVSCVVLAFGIFLIVKADITYLPGEGLAVAVSETFNIEFGTVKTWLDTSMVAIGTLSSFILMNQLQGIREGTFFAALSVGFLIRFFNDRIPLPEMSKV